MTNWMHRFIPSLPGRSSAVAAKIDAGPDEAEACKNRGNAHLSAGRTDAAIDCYRQAIAIRPEYAEAHNNLGFVYLRLGRLEEAEHHLTHALAVNPELANAHFNLGTLFRQRANAEQALSSFRKAVALGPDNAAACHGLGKLLLELGRYDEAVENLRHAAELSPDHFMAHFDLGTALRNQGRRSEALACFQRAIALDPESADAYFEAGSEFLALKQYAAAALYFRQAIDRRPDYHQAHNNLGLCFLRQDRFDEALPCFEQALRITESAVAYKNMGDIFFRQGRLDDALACQDKAIALAPDLADAYLTKGVTLKEQGKLDQALDCLDEAIMLAPDLPDARLMRGVVLTDQDRLDDAESGFREVLARHPGNDAARFGIATVHLHRGDLAEGWQGYGTRFFGGSTTRRRDFPQPPWRGEALAEKRLLLWGDQGVGDEVFFAGMFPDVIDRAGQCVIECTPKLVTLFARSFPRAIVVPRTDPPHPAALTDIDFQVAASDAARWLRPTLASFPRHDGYLHPDPQRIEFWRTRLAALGPGLKIGFCWRSSLRVSHRNLHYSDLDQWGPIFAVPGVHFVNLQYDECDAELAAARQRFGVPLHAFPEVDLFDDLDEAAALTKAVDLVITAPTAASRLAAALGVPTWEMGYGTTWINHGTDHVPWYPSLRLFMRRWNQPWEDIISTVSRHLIQHRAG